MKKRFFSGILALLMLAAVLVSALPASAMGGSVDLGDVIEYQDAKSLTFGYLMFYPEALETDDAQYPVVVWANGTMCPPALYTGLLYQFAKAGYVVVASSKVMSADGKAQREAIDYILGENEDPNSVFYGKIDESRIAAAGHSQGGRSSVNAAADDDRIGCVVSIAGSSLPNEAKKLSTPTLFLTGTADLIVPSAIWVKPAHKKCTGAAAYASLKGAVHTTCCIAPDSISEYAVPWMDAWLNGDSDALAQFQPGGKLSRDKGWKDFTCKNF